MVDCLVEHVMTPVQDCVVIELEDTIRMLKQKLRHNKQRAAIVINARGTVAGVITVKDLQFAGDDNRISDWYKAPAYTIPSDEPIEKARHQLNVHGNHQLIVVDDRKKPMGILWDTDAVLGCTPDDDDFLPTDDEKKKDE